MSKQRGRFRTWFPVLGGALVVVGLLVLFVQVDGAANQLAERVGVSIGDRGEMMPAALLATLRAAQALAFDRANVISAVREILVSFWPMILVILGAALLRGTFSQFARSRRNGQAAAQGEL